MICKLPGTSARVSICMCVCARDSLWTRTDVCVRTTPRWERYTSRRFAHSRVIATDTDRFFGPSRHFIVLRAYNSLSRSLALARDCARERSRLVVRGFGFWGIYGRGGDEYVGCNEVAGADGGGGFTVTKMLVDSIIWTSGKVSPS